MKFLILTVNSTLHSICELSRSLNNYNLEHQIMDPFKFNQDEVMNTSYDCILNRVSGISYNDQDLEFLENYSKRWPKTLIINDPIQTRVFRDKYKQFELYKASSIPTIESLNLENTSVKHIEEFTKAHTTLKYLLKPLRSNQARGIQITEIPVNNFKKLQELKDTKYILQPLILKKCEWRVLLIDNQILGVLKKETSNDDELLNCEVATLTEVSQSDTPKELRELVSKVINASKLYIQALDILEDHQGNYLLIEVNNVPGLKYFEKTTGISPAKKLTQRIISNLRS